jgi:hypothetical protein
MLVGLGGIQITAHVDDGTKTASGTQIFFTMVKK